MIVFGVAAIFMGVTGFNTTRDAIKDEGIVFGGRRPCSCRAPSSGRASR